MCHHLQKRLYARSTRKAAVQLASHGYFTRCPAFFTISHMEGVRSSTSFMFCLPHSALQWRSTAEPPGTWQRDASWTDCNVEYDCALIRVISQSARQFLQTSGHAGFHVEPVKFKVSVWLRENIAGCCGWSSTTTRCWQTAQPEPWSRDHASDSPKDKHCWACECRATTLLTRSSSRLLRSWLYPRMTRPHSA